MAREFARHQRMAEQIKHELARLVQQRFPTCEYGLISVSSVDLSPDLGNAKVFVTCLDRAAASGLVQALNEHKGELRNILSKTVHARSVPKLCFEHDDTPARAERIASLLASAKRN